MICGSDDILAKPTNDNGKIANGGVAKCIVGDVTTLLFWFNI
jgi:hypothetical protein